MSKLFFASLAALVVTVAFLSGCGRPGPKEGYLLNTRDCSYAFLLDYGTVTAHMESALRTNRQLNPEPSDKAINLAQEFKKKWGGVVCETTLYNDTHLPSEKSTIDATKEMDQILVKLKD